MILYVSTKVIHVDWLFWKSLFNGMGIYVDYILKSPEPTLYQIYWRSEHLTTSINKKSQKTLFSTKFIEVLQVKNFRRIAAC